MFFVFLNFKLIFDIEIEIINCKGGYISYRDIKMCLLFVFL